MKKIILLMLLMTASAYSKETCDSSDQRSMMEQLDCFCGDKPVIQQKIDKLGVLSKTFTERESINCGSAVVKTLTSSKESNVSSEVSKKLKSLNYTDEQIEKTVSTVAKRIDAAKLVKNGSCSSSTVSISIWPFSYKSSESAECAAFKKMDPSEQEAAMMLAMTMNPLIKSPDGFNYQFKEIEEANKIVAKYPESRISKCLELTKSIDGTAECSNSKADENKIDSCASLGMGQINSVKCLQSNTDASGIKSCKYLNLGETNTIRCLDINPDGQLVRNCKFLKFGETNTMNCLKVKPDASVAEACNFLNFGETNTMSCLQVKPNETLAKACKLLKLGETNTMNCLQMNPSLALAQSCNLLNLGETSTINCLKIKPEPAIASACKNLNVGEMSTINCLKAGASPEKIQQCGMKYNSELQTISCLTEKFTEKPASAQVSDIPRAPKEWIDDEDAYETPLKMKGNGVAK